MENTIVLDEIAPGATIRFTVIDGVQYLSTRDFIMHICEKDNKYASDLWMDLSESKKSEVSKFLRTFKFPGKGQKNQPVITFPGAIKLMMLLPGKNAKKNSSIMCRILVRHFAGDKSLLQTLDPNTQSDAPIGQMASSELILEASAVEVQSQALSHKRKLDDLEMEERIVNIKYKRAQINKINAETRMLQMKILQDVIHQYTTLCDPDLFMDNRAIFKDKLIQFITSQQ
jgi:hypothetical protein